MRIIGLFIKSLEENQNWIKKETPQGNLFHKLIKQKSLKGY